MIYCAECNETFGKLVGVTDEEPVSRHYSCSVALENRLDQKLSSHLLIYKTSILIYENSVLIYKNSVSNYETSNLTFEAHVIRTLNS